MLPDTPATVMCVEDDPDMLQLLRMTIALDPDFELVATVTDASVVLDTVRVHRPDVVILDHVVPGPLRKGGGGPSGQALASWLELVRDTRVIVPHALIVVFSGWDGIQSPALDGGADLCIAKSELQTLLPSIRSRLTA